MPSLIPGLSSWLPRILAAVLWLVLSWPAAGALVLTAELRGAVSPASAAYFERVLAEARGRQATLVVLTLDTPGGLDSSMREMIQQLFASPVPVAVFVYPSGARAASAGTYLMYASHVAVMAPGTNLGAATPVAIGIGGSKPEQKPAGKKAKPEAGDEAEALPADAMAAKATQDAAAYLRSLAQLRGRNAEWAEQAVRQAKSLSADEALQSKVIDLVVRDVPELLRRIDGRIIKLDVGEPRQLKLADAGVIAIERSWKEKMLARLADPNIALILMMLGVYGLLFEFYSPGMALPGVIGGICLLLGAYGLALLPINYVGVALILLGIAFMVSEMFLPSFGVLGLGGIVSFVAGALLLVDAEVPGVSVSWPVLVPFAVLSGLAAALTGFFVMRSRQRPTVAGSEAMLGGPVVALENFDPSSGEGWVAAFGERWRARCRTPLVKGSRGRVLAREGLVLIVEPVEQGEKP
ncbi:MAG TPA: nodulation protein NfeD [Rhodocyclaceae bacterium]|nr:nodulation protein NfeD [Rhodocyclaceae bacterium]